MKSPLLALALAGIALGGGRDNTSPFTSPVANTGKGISRIAPGSRRARSFTQAKGTENVPRLGLSRETQEHNAKIEAKRQEKLAAKAAKRAQRGS